MNFKNHFGSLCFSSEEKEKKCTEMLFWKSNVFKTGDRCPFYIEEKKMSLQVVVWNAASGAARAFVLALHHESKLKWKKRNKSNKDLSVSLGFSGCCPSLSELWLLVEPLGVA